MPSLIVPVLTPRPKQLAAYLQSEGSLIVRGITYPTVPQGQDRVRICMHADNTEEEIRKLAALVKRWDADQCSQQAGTEQRQLDSFSASQNVSAKL
jgi:8-amino-7-oxononanoate synthase